MNIVIIGASNSIIGEKGYLLALRSSYNVVNLSGGDIPIGFTISKLLQHKDVIARADWVILDHSISDRAIYHPRLGKAYLDQIDEAYQLATQINPNVISLAFPVLRDTAGDHDYLAALTRICQRHAVKLISFQGVVTDRRAYEDPLHVHCETSFLMGDFLAGHIATLAQSADKSRARPTPYHRVSGATLAPGSAVRRFESGLGTADYVQIDRPIEIVCEHMQSLVYIEYIVLRDEARYLACAINGRANFFGGLDITGDVIMAAPSKRFVLEPVSGDAPLTLTHSDRHSVPGPFAHMNLVSVLFRKEGHPVPEPTIDTHSAADIDFSQFTQALSMLGDSSWYQDTKHMSDTSAKLIADLNAKGLSQHKRYFGPTFDDGAKIRSARISRFLEFRKG